MCKKLTQARVRELFDYDPDTGDLTWKPGTPKEGQIATRLWRKGVKYKTTPYFTVFFDRKQYRAHRVAWLWVHGSLPTILDHINGDGTDNRLTNLRPATDALNAKNMPLRADNKSGYPGVHWRKDLCQWQSKVKHNRKLKHLGYFDKLEDAIDAAKAKHAELGFHPNHGRSPDVPA